jgi:hypothetical protein
MRLNAKDIMIAQEEAWTEYHKYCGLRFLFSAKGAYKVMSGLKTIYLGNSLHEAIGEFEDERKIMDKEMSFLYDF